MTVFFSADGYEKENDELFFLMELMQSGLAQPCCRDLNHLKALRYTDGNGNDFISFNFVLDIEGKGQYMSWNGDCCRFEELNRLNSQ